MRDVLPKAAARAGGALVVLAAAVACHRFAPPQPGSGPPPAGSPARAAGNSSSPLAASSPVRQEPAALPDFQVEAVSTREGLAVWYDVPAGSLAQRRAWPEEMTAASDTLALGTYARVTRLENGRSVVVRVTDRGIHLPNTMIDLDRQAAEALQMIRAGKVRVKLEVLALKNADAAGPSPKVSAQTSPPKAPGASATEEKANAERKSPADDHTPP